jgi:hypothetical protein
LFYTYGHVFDLFQKKSKIPLPVWLGGLWLVLAILALIWAGRSRTHFQNAALTLNIISLGLTLFAAGQVVRRSIPPATQTDKPVDPHATIQALHVPAGQTPPDIYYFILDSYGRDDR